MATSPDPEPLKGKLQSLLLVAESVKSSFIDAHYHPPAFINELGYFISIIKQLLLVQTSDAHESERFDAVIAVICQCHGSLDGVSSRLVRAGNGQVGDRRSSLLRYYIKEEMQDEIKGLRDMISKNIQAVSTMLSIQNITRSTALDITGPGLDAMQTRRRPSSAELCIDPDDLMMPLLSKSPSPVSNEWHPRRASKAVHFTPTIEPGCPERVYPRQDPFGLFDAATNIELLPSPYDVESQTHIHNQIRTAIQKRSKREPQYFISLLSFMFFLSVGLVFLLYFGIKKHDISTGVGILGSLLSVSTIIDQFVQWLHRRRGLRCERCRKI